MFSYEGAAARVAVVGDVGDRFVISGNPGHSDTAARRIDVVPVEGRLGLEYISFENLSERMALANIKSVMEWIERNARSKDLWLLLFNDGANRCYLPSETNWFGAAPKPAMVVPVKPWTNVAAHSLFTFNPRYLRGWLGNPLRPEEVDSVAVMRTRPESFVVADFGGSPNSKYYDIGPLSRIDFLIDQRMWRWPGATPNTEVTATMADAPLFLSYDGTKILTLSEFCKEGLRFQHDGKEVDLMEYIVLNPNLLDINGAYVMDTCQTREGAVEWVVSFLAPSTARILCAQNYMMMMDLHPDYSGPINAAPSLKIMYPGEHRVLNDAMMLSIYNSWQPNPVFRPNRFVENNDGNAFHDEVGWDLIGIGLANQKIDGVVTLIAWNNEFADDASDLPYGFDATKFALSCARPGDDSVPCYDSKVNFEDGEIDFEPGCVPYVFAPFILHPKPIPLNLRVWTSDVRNSDIRYMVSGFFSNLGAATAGNKMYNELDMEIVNRLVEAGISGVVYNGQSKSTASTGATQIVNANSLMTTHELARYALNPRKQQMYCVRENTYLQVKHLVEHRALISPHVKGARVNPNNRKCLKEILAKIEEIGSLRHHPKWERDRPLHPSTIDFPDPPSAATGDPFDFGPFVFHFWVNDTKWPAESTFDQFDVFPKWLPLLNGLNQSIRSYGILSPGATDSEGSFRDQDGVAFAADSAGWKRTETYFTDSHLVKYNSNSGSTFFYQTLTYPTPEHIYYGRTQVNENIAKAVLYLFRDNYARYGNGGYVAGKEWGTVAQTRVGSLFASFYDDIANIAGTEPYDVINKWHTAPLNAKNSTKHRRYGNPGPASITWVTNRTDSSGYYSKGLDKYWRWASTGHVFACEGNGVQPPASILRLVTFEKHDNSPLLSRPGANDIYSGEGSPYLGQLNWRTALTNMTNRSAIYGAGWPEPPASTDDINLYAVNYRRLAVTDMSPLIYNGAPVKSDRDWRPRSRFPRIPTDARIIDPDLHPITVLTCSLITEDVITPSKQFKQQAPIAYFHTKEILDSLALKDETSIIPIAELTRNELFDFRNNYNKECIFSIRLRDTGEPILENTDSKLSLVAKVRIVSNRFQNEHISEHGSPYGEHPR